MVVDGADRILVLRLGAIGDSLRVLPAVRRLRIERPNAVIAWAIEDWVHPLLAGNPNVDRFHVLRRRRFRAGLTAGLAEVVRFIKEVRAARYETALDFHGRLKSGLVGFLSGSRQRIGYARGYGTEANHIFNNVHVTLQDRYENRVLRFLRLLAPLGIQGDFDPRETGLHLDSTIALEGRAWHEKSGRPMLGAYPGTSRNQASYHRWPRGKWIDLLLRLRKGGVSSVLFWGPDDVDFTRSIVDGAAGACSLAPRTTLVEMMAMIGCFKAFIGSNTAATHMAWLQGVPTAMFPGPAHPRTDAPLPPVPSRLLWAGQHFEPGKPKRYQAQVVTEVSVEEALCGVMDMLAAGSTDRGRLL